MSDEQPKEQTNDNNGVDQTNLEEQVKEDYRFNTKIAKEAIQETLLEHLKDREYSQIEAEPLSKTISREIKERLKDHCLENRYKLMVQVVLGERNGAGTRFEACCIWDDDTDTQVSGNYILCGDSFRCLFLLINFGLNLALDAQKVSGPKLVNFESTLTSDPVFVNRVKDITKEVEDFAEQFYIPERTINIFIEH